MLKKYYREFSIVLLAIALIISSTINFKARHSVDDLIEKNERIKSEAAHLMQLNDSITNSYIRKRDSLRLLIDSLDNIIPKKESDIQEIITKIKRYSNIPDTTTQKERDALWQSLKEQ